MVKNRYRRKYVSTAEVSLIVTFSLYMDRIHSENFSSTSTQHLFENLLTVLATTQK